MAVGLDLPFSQASGRILFIFSSLLLLLVVVQEFASGNKHKAISSTSAALSSTTSAPVLYRHFAELDFDFGVRQHEWSN